MADSKITGLSADTAPSSDDLLVTVNDPAGTPANKKVTIGAISPFFGAQNATVATSETTTSTSYADLTTTTDSVTVTIGNNGMALVSIYSYFSNATTSTDTYVGFAISGATTQAATDTLAVDFQTWANGAQGRYGGTFLLTGLAAGSTTFKMKYRVGASTGTFKDRRIAVVPL